MTNLDTLRALVELGEKVPPESLMTMGPAIIYDGRYCGRDGEELGGPERIAEADDPYRDFFTAAANARPVLAALIAEFEKAVGLLKEAKPAVNATIKGELVSYPGLTPLVPKDLYDRIAAFLAANKQESA